MTGVLTPEDERWMGEALAVAAEGLAAGELPIGTTRPARWMT